MILYGGSGEGAPSLSVRPTDIQSQRMKGRKEKEKGRKNERAFTASFADDTEPPLQACPLTVTPLGATITRPDCVQ